MPVFLVNILYPSMAASIPIAVANYKDAFFELVILHFAGLALIIMAIIRELKINKYLLLFFAIVIAIISPMLWGIGADIPVAGHLLDYLWGDKPSTEKCIGTLVSFPFFPWFTFVLIGMFLGDILTKSTNINKTFKKMGLIGFLVLIASSVIVLVNPAYHFGDYYHSRPGAVVFIIGIILTWLYLCHVVVENIKMNRVFDILFFWSKNVNSLYIIQWVLAMWGAATIFGFYKSSYYMTVAVMIMLINVY